MTRKSHHAKRGLLLGLAGLLALPLLAPQPAAQQRPFGLRNIRLLTDWDDTDFDTEFDGHRAGHVAFWTFWGDFQENPPPEGMPPTYEFEVLDDALAMCSIVGADPVIVFHLTNTPTPFGGTSSGPFWGMHVAGQSGQEFTQPKDLTVPPPSTCPNPEVSYSPRLYGVSRAMADHIATTLGSGTVWMRFHNEPWDEWALGNFGPANVYRYLLSYLTFRRAILDAEAASTNPGVTFKVSHGSIPRTRLAARELYAEFESGTAAEQQAVADQFDSWIERSRCKIGNQLPALASGANTPAYITSWADAGLYVDDTAATNQRHDLWLDKFIEWKALCADAAGRPIFEFTNTHPHGKVAPMYYDRVYFDQAVQDLMNANMIAGTPPPWVGAEVGFQLSDQANWGVHPLPGAGLDGFIAEDMARKWCILVHEFKLFCSPILAGFPNFRGLYRKQTSAQPQTGCPLGTVTQGASTQCSTSGLPVICEDKANQAYLFLSDTVGGAQSSDELGSVEDSHTHYRYYLPNGVVDALWRNELSDSNTTISDVPISVPQGYICGDVFDPFGVKVGVVGLTPGGPKVKDVGQAPRIIVWRCKLQEL